MYILVVARLFGGMRRVLRVRADLGLYRERVRRGEVAAAERPPKVEDARPAVDLERTYALSNKGRRGMSTKRLDYM